MVFAQHVQSTVTPKNTRLCTENPPKGYCIPSPTTVTHLSEVLISLLIVTWLYNVSQSQDRHQKEARSISYTCIEGCGVHYLAVGLPMAIIMPTQ